jgi:CBS domain containing-hemolysin-like protein
MCRNGIFAMSEIALVTARRARLQRMVEDGDRAAASALELGENPTRFLSTIQIGITSIGIHGVVQGLVTLHDVMEAITGEFKPTSQDDAWAVRRDDGSWLLDGLIPVHEFKDRLGLRELPEEDKGRYHTLSGMLMLELGACRAPATPSTGTAGASRSSTWTTSASTRCWSHRCPMPRRRCRRRAAMAGIARPPE